MRNEKIKKGYELIGDIMTLHLPNDWDMNSLLRDVNIYSAGLRYLEGDPLWKASTIKEILGRHWTVVRILDKHNWDHYSRELTELKDWILKEIKKEKKMYYIYYTLGERTICTLGFDGRLQVVINQITRHLNQHPGTTAIFTIVEQAEEE